MNHHSHFLKQVSQACLVGLLSVFLVSCATKKPAKKSVVLAYVTSWTSIMPDPAVLTHINYAFGHVTDSFNAVRVDNGERLHSLVALKAQKPSLQILLSVGGWGSGRFSEMAASDKNRAAFAQDCQRIVAEYGLDGIDIDWEYPTQNSAGISSSPDDTNNFTLLMRDIRAAIGADKLLTLATVANGKYIDLAGIEPYVNFVNIMTYDISSAPYHHASLFRSEMTQGVSCEDAVKAHVAGGFPIDRLVLGIPFYGRSAKDFGPSNYKDIIRKEGYQRNWDDVAKVPYLTDSTGVMVCGYEDALSIAEKCKFLKEKGMLGAMYWEYNGDDEQGTLQKAVYNGVMQ